MSDETPTPDLPPITGTLAPESMGDPANLLMEGISGEATGTVSDPVGIEDTLAAMGLAEPPGGPAPEVAIAPEFFVVNVAGSPTDADVYISNGSLELRIPRNKDTRVSAAVLAALMHAEGLSFTHKPA